MPRDIQEPTLNKYGDETHPAFGKITVNRRTGGYTLFDSSIQHNNTVVLTVSRASRKRDLHRDWIHGGKQLVELVMSEAQWAGMVSSFGDGSGTPVTLTYLQHEGDLPAIPFESRLAVSAKETGKAAHAAFDAIQEAYAALEALPMTGSAKERREAMRNLKYAIANAPSNVEFAAKSLTEHTENVIQKAKADVEAFVTARAEHLGIEASQIGEVFALTDGSEQ